MTHLENLTELSGIRSRVVMLTPDAAQEILDDMIQNRRAQAFRINQLVDALKNDRFLLTGATLVQASDGRWIDGQHRCLAVIKSGIPAPVVLIQGVDPRALPLIDQGKSRTAADIMRMDGVQNVTSVSALARLVMSVEIYKDQTRLITPPLVAAYVRDHLDDLAEPSRVGKNAQMKLRAQAGQAASPGLFGLAMYYIIGAGNNVNLVDEWITRVAEGDGISKGSPEYAIRGYLIGVGQKGKNISSGNHLEILKMVNPVIRAWNDHVNPEDRFVSLYRAGAIKRLDRSQVIN
ncbi:hypothetical protein SEA_FRIBS8_49 [Gordonia phage Fribs8]|nr:hypothetical protein SEA_FRIBS8_49 [Gordonia phage Fribs8]